MKELTEQELQRAFAIWHHYYSQSVNASETTAGNLKKLRKSLLLSTTALASKLGVSTATYARYEKTEVDGVISLKTLRRIAEAMNFEFSYSLKAKNQKSGDQVIWEILLMESLKHPWLNVCDPKRRGEALAGIAKRKMDDPEFRRSQGWSHRKN